MELTEQQVWNLVVYGTVAILLMAFGLIVIVLYFNRQSRGYDEQLAQLRAKHRQEIKQAKGNTEDEYLMISGGRKVKNKNWKGNTLKDSHIMD